jgi:hypothetical protein
VDYRVGFALGGICGVFPEEDRRVSDKNPFDELIAQLDKEGKLELGGDPGKLRLFGQLIGYLHSPKRAHSEVLDQLLIDQAMAWAEKGKVGVVELRSILVLGMAYERAFFSRELRRGRRLTLAMAVGAIALSATSLVLRLLGVYG